MNKKIIIIGASSGIGRELALMYAQEGNVVGISGRRVALLQEIAQKYPKNIHIAEHDICQGDNQEILSRLIDTIGGLDVLIISAGVGFDNVDLDFNKEKQTIATNVTGFTEIITFGYTYFLKQKHGHIVGISSIAAIRGVYGCPAYSASKAYELNYLEAIRKQSKKDNSSLYVTTIIPGFVNTQMAKGEGLFWVAPVHKAAYQIKKAIERKKSIAYITKRWRFIAYLLKCLPNIFYDNM